MPAMANMTVKAADGTTDVVYVAQNPAGGDGVKALWRANAIGTTAASHPWVTLSSRSNKGGSARRLDYEYRYPYSYTDTTTGLVSIKDQVIATGSFLLPLGAPDTLVNEPACQLGRILALNMFWYSFREGFAPT